MAEPNTRLVVTGAPKADREFTRYLAERRRVVKQLDRTLRAIERAARKAERSRG